MNRSVLAGTVRRRAPTAGRPWLVAVLGTLLVVLAAVRILSVSSWDPTALIAFGEAAPAITEYAEDALGRNVLVREQFGHDGKFFFIQAADPWYLDPSLHAVHLDRPTYRAQRMLYPTLASGLGTLPPAAIQWTMLLVNVAAVGVGTFATAQLAREMGGSSWLGLAFALNLGVVSDLMIGGAGIVALALGVLGTLALERDRLSQAAVWLALASLTREVMLVFAAGAALLALKRVGWRAAWLGVAPALAVIVWAVYVRLRLGDSSLAADVSEIGAWPFEGIVNAIPNWSDRVIDPLVAGLLLLLGVGLLVRSIIRPTYIGWASSGFLVLSLFLSHLVWSRYFDIARAFGPVMTAYVLVLFTEKRGLISKVRTPVER